MSDELCTTNLFRGTCREVRCDLFVFVVVTPEGHPLSKVSLISSHLISSRLLVTWRDVNALGIAKLSDKVGLDLSVTTRMANQFTSTLRINLIPHTWWSDDRERGVDFFQGLASHRAA